MSSPIDNIKPQESLLDTRLWRHTGGRISCALRLPFYAVSLAGRVTAAALECLITAVTCTQLRRVDFFKDRCCTVNHCKKDLLVSIVMVHRIAQSILGIICAPAKGYHSLGESVQLAISREAQGKRPKDASTKDSVNFQTLLDAYWKASPKWSKMILACESIYSNSITAMIKTDTTLPENLKSDLKKILPRPC